MISVPKALWSKSHMTS